MSKRDTSAGNTAARTPEETPWQRLAATTPIRIRDPLAEVLGMVPAGEPLVVTFADVAKAAGHACPAVAGAYRGTQLALDRLYPDESVVETSAPNAWRSVGWRVRMLHGQW